MIIWFGIIFTSVRIWLLVYVACNGNTVVSFTPLMTSPSSTWLLITSFSLWTVEMNGVLGQDSALVRQYWAGDNLGYCWRTGDVEKIDDEK